jgi:hypothetical protein
MADTTINFNPAKFVSGLAKSTASALSSTLTEHIPFTSELIKDASDTAFNVKEFIAENRPDKTSRNTSSVIRTFTTKTANASKVFLSDLAHGDISLSRTREGLVKYLKKNLKSESEFDFDFDMEGDEDNENMPEAESFTAEDYAQGVYESTMATVGAIEVSSNKLALSNAKSNDILANKLIANNMTNMAQTMQMLETINSNVSGVNNNLASLVEYNNTTMNDFIKATTTHFAKVEKFMDLISKQYEEEKRDYDDGSKNKVFKDNRIQWKALINRASDVASEHGSFELSSFLSGLAEKNKSGPMDLSSIFEGIRNINPAELLFKAILPEMQGLDRIDKQVENMMSAFRYKLTHDKRTGGFFDSNSPIGKIVLQLFGDNDDFKLFKYFKNKNTQWKTSDSQAIQLIPSILDETKETISNIGVNVENIVTILRNIEANGFNLAPAQLTSTKAADLKIFDSSSGKLESVDKKIAAGKYELLGARLAGSELITDFIRKLITDNESTPIDSAVTDKINEQLSDYLVNLFNNKIDVDASGGFIYGKVKDKINQILKDSGDTHAIDESTAADFMGILMNAQEKRAMRTDAAVNRLSVDEAFKRAVIAKKGKFSAYDLMEQDYLDDYLQSERAQRYIGYMTEVADQLSRNASLIRASYINEPLSRHEFEVGDAAYKAAEKKAEEAVKQMEKRHRSQHAGSLFSNTVSNNAANFFVRAVADTLNTAVNSLSNFILTGDKTALSDLGPSDLMHTFTSSYANRSRGAQSAYENGVRKTKYYYDKKAWGRRFKVDADGKMTEEEDPDYTEVKMKNASDPDGPYIENPKTHEWEKTITDTNGKETTVLSPHQYTQPAFATGATRIDRDKIVQVHEGEMILDKSLSEDVRTGLKNMINQGGFSKLSKDEQDALLKSIRESDERFKDHEMDVIKAVSRVVDQYDQNTISSMALNPSKDSVCFIDIDDDDSFSSVLVKKITEIAVNLGIMAQTTLNHTEAENNADAKSKMGKGAGLVTGTKNEAGMYTGGFFSNEINRVKDEINYRRFKYLDGKEYKGYTRDENGRIVEGGGVQTYSNSGVGADKSETIMQKLRESAKANAEAFAASQGWEGDQKKEYIESIDRLMQGIPGALKGGVVGLALSGVLGSAVGLIGGFALTNKETREFIFGKPYKDPDGGHHMVGGIFGSITNKLVETADDIKNNFLDAFRDVPKNIKNAFQHFVNRLTGEDNESILGGLKKFFNQITGDDSKSLIGKVLSGVKNTAQQVAEGASDIALDAVTIGSKLVFKAASLPFNAFASLIGGKDYRDEKNKEAKELKSKRMRALYEELIANDKAAGINSISLLPIKDAVKRFFDYRSLDNEYREFGDKSLGGKLSTNLEDIPLFKKLGAFTDTFAKFTADFMPNAIRGLAGSVLGGALMATGHPVLGGTLLATTMSNAIAKQIFGTGILSIVGNAFKRLGARAKRTFKKPINAIKNRLHFVKESLGIHDTKYYLNKLTGSDQFENSNILGDLDIDPETQAKYYEALNIPADKRNPDQAALVERINGIVSSGLSEGDKADLDAVQGYQDMYKKILKTKAKDRTVPEKEFLAGYRKNAAKIKASKSVAKNRARFFEAKYGKKNYQKILKENAEQFKENPDLLQSRFNYANNLFASDEDIDTAIRTTGSFYAEDGPEGERRRREMRDELTKRRKDILAYVRKNGGEITEANRGKIIEMMKKSLGKTDNAFNGIDNEKLMNFLMWGNHGEEAQKIENDFKAKVETTTTSILNVLKAIGRKLGVSDNAEKGSLGHGLDNDNIIEEAQEMTAQKFEEVRVNLKESNGVMQTIMTGQDKTFEDIEKINDNIQKINDQVNSANGDNDLFSFNNPTINPGLPGGINIDDALESGEQHLKFGNNPITGSLPIGNGPGDEAAAGGLGAIFGSMSDSLKGILTVFTGDETGYGEAKMSFLDKMRESFSSVGNLISNTVMGSGLIPLKPNGQIDTGKLVARLIALIGGTIILGPTIAKLFEKIAPLLEPVFTGLANGVGTVLKGGLNLLAGLDFNNDDLLLTFETLVSNFKNCWDGIFQRLGARAFDESPAGSALDVNNSNQTLPTLLEGKEDRQKEITKFQTDTNPYDANTVMHALYEGAKHSTDAYVALNGKPSDNGKNGKTIYTRSFATASDEITYCSAVERYRDALTYFVAEYQMNNIRILGVDVGYVFLNPLDDKRLTNAERDFLTLAINEGATFSNKEMPTKYNTAFFNAVKSAGGIEIEKNPNGETETDIRIKNITGVYKSQITTGVQHLLSRAITVRDVIGGATDISKIHPLATPEDRFSEDHMDYYNREDIINAGNGIGYGYTQNDPRWARQSYGSFKSGRGSTIGSGGCGPTTMANVYSNLTGRRINPGQMARFSQSNGYNAQGGTSAGLFTNGARKLGLASRAISKSGNAIGNSIRHGNNVVIAGKNGPYTRAGHIMSVRGVDSRGNAIVDDPLKRGARRIPMNRLTKGMTHAWSIGRGNSIGYGELYAPNGEGDWYSTWWDDPDVPATGTSYDPNGGGFGYTLEDGCVYISNINAYLNSVMRKLGYNNFTDLITAYNFSPRKFAKDYPNSRKGKQIRYDTTYAALDEIFGTDLGSKINLLPFYPVSEGHYTPQELYDLLYSNLKAGNPIAFSSNNGAAEKWRDIIIGKEYYAAGGNSSMHSVLLAGLQTDGDKEYLVVDNPNRAAGSFGANNNSTHFYRVDLDYFRNAVLTSDQNHEDIKRVSIFPKNGVINTVYSKKRSPKDEFESYIHGFSNGAFKSDAEFNAKYPNGKQYKSYADWAAAYPDLAKRYESDASSTSTATKYTPMAANYDSSGIFSSGLTQNINAGTVQTVTTDARESTNATTFADWISDLVSKFATLGSNAIGAFLTGDVDSAFKTTRTIYNGGSYTSGGSGYSGGSGNGASGSIPTIVIDAAYVKGMIESAYEAYANSSSINSELGKNDLAKYVITTGNYTSLTGDSRYSQLLIDIAASTNYKKYVAQTVANIYTWLVAQKAIRQYPDEKSYAYASKYSSGGVGSVIDNIASEMYNKIKGMQIAFGQPTDDYSLLPSWAKTSDGDGIPSAGNEVSTLHYLMDLMTKAETGGDVKNPADIDKIYFNPLWHSGESGITIGRGGFYNANAKTVFTTAAKSPNLSETTRNMINTIATGIGNHSLSTSDVKSYIEQYPDMKPALITAQDAMMNEYAWGYISKAAAQYNKRGMKDPRSIILGAEFAGIGPAYVPSFYSAVTSPGASNELDQVRQGMLNTLPKFPNYGKYGDGWRNRINGMYSMITSEGNGKNPWNGIYYPLPAHIISSIPSNMNLIPTVSIGNGDAGCNMRDGYQLYKDDVYMGDADNPMHVVMDSSPVTSRIDKLIELIEAAVNPKDEPKSGPSDAKSNSIGAGTNNVTIPANDKGYSKGVTSVGQKDKLAQLHARIARRTRTQINYAHY